MNIFYGLCITIRGSGIGSQTYLKTHGDLFMLSGRDFKPWLSEHSRQNQGDGWEGEFLLQASKAFLNSGLDLIGCHMQYP